MFSQLAVILRHRLTSAFSIALLLIFSVQHISANTTDSLSAALKNHRQADSGRVTLLASLSMAYASINLDSAIAIGNNGLSLAQKINYEKGQVLCWEGLGIAYINKNEYGKSLDCYNAALQIAQKLNDNEAAALICAHIGEVYTHQQKHGIAIDYFKKSIVLSKKINALSTEGLALMGMGSLYSDLGNLTEAAKCYLDALRIFEKDDDITGRSSALSNVATVYSSLGDFKRSLDYNQQSLDIFIKMGNKTGILSSYVNSGVTHGEMNDFRGAIALFNKGLALADSIGEKYWRNICLADIGEAYYNLGSYDTAYQKYTVALAAALSMGDKENIAQTQNGIGAILVKRGETAEGIKHLLISYGIMHDAGLKEPAQEIAMNLSNAYEKIHDFPEALHYYKIYSSYSDSLYKERSSKRIQQLQFDYELGKKENQISLLEKDTVIEQNKNEKQAAIMWASLVTAGLLIIVSFLLYRSRAYEKRSKDELLKQKEEIQQQAVKLRELNGFKDKTFSVLSHDLRGPIDSFYSIIKLLDEKQITMEEYGKLKPEMTAQIASLTVLLDNLLKWSSSYMKGAVTVKPVNADLTGIVLQNLNLVQGAAKRKNITLINQATDPVFAFCGPGQIDIVIRNLTMNAVKFTRPGGTVTLSAHNDASYVYFAVADNGVGMDKAQLDKLFVITPDNHTYGTEGETGTGLGLLLCYEFIKANNGTISAVSEKNVGSTFTVRLNKQPA